MNINSIQIGDPVIYVPNHLLVGDRSKMIVDDNLGIVTSKNDKHVFVRYRDKEGSEATNPHDLYTLKNRPDLMEKLGIEIKPDTKINELYLNDKNL